MNKSELINSVASKSGLTKEQAGKSVNAFMESIVESLQNDDKVALIGFGTFSVVEKAERQGINPATKQTITIPAKKVAKFKPGSDFKL